MSPWRKWKRSRRTRKKANASEYWYDLFEDWELIESSFAMQYNIRLSQTEMDWKEFCVLQKVLWKKMVLLSGIMPKTPLGTVVGIRSEENNEVLKHYTREQHRIRNEWRSNHNPMDRLTEDQKIDKAREMQKILAQAFGGKEG